MVQCEALAEERDEVLADCDVLSRRLAMVNDTSDAAEVCTSLLHPSRAASSVIRRRHASQTCENL